MTAATPSAARPAIALAADHVTPYDRLTWTDEQVEPLLASGAQRQELEAYFGPEEYRVLARLARRAQAARPHEPAHRVIVVPGIMGSQLALPRRAPLPPDLLWIDPVDIGAGRLTALSCSQAATLAPAGVVLYSYLRLKLHLRIAGFQPSLYAYDWRQSIDELGARLAERLRGETAARVAMIGHSMGGLVCRAALACPGSARVERLLLLGAPNFGSVGALQALRGTYAVVRKLARLDHAHSAEDLAAEVFSTFPSLYQMLPAPGYAGRLDLYDPAVWPSAGPQPSVALLERARELGRSLAAADERCAVIVGVAQETVTEVARRSADFVYTVTRHGDGTVPIRCAVLPGARQYYAAVSHSELTRHAGIAAAIAELLRRGATRRLPERWHSASRARARIGDRELARTQLVKVDLAHLSANARRLFLQNLNEPPKLRLRVPGRRHASQRAVRAGSRARMQRRARLP